MSFSFPKVTLNKIDVTDNEMAVLATAKKASIRPGQQALKIVNLENKGNSDKDPSFVKVMVTYESIEGATIRDFLLVPTTSLRFKGGKDKRSELFPIQKLVSVFEAVGETPSMDDIPDLISRYFGKSKLIGEKVEVVVGYKQDHVKYIAPGLYVVADRDDNPYLTPTGEYAISGPDRQTCDNNALLAHHKLNNWPEILKYIPGGSDAEDSDDASF